MPPILGALPAHGPVQFLNSVLAQGGPNALPYEEGLKLAIRSHLVALLEEFPSLQVKTAAFTHNDGNTVHLLQVDGTVPMYYLEVMYNIPVTIWLLESYPKNPPRIFVNPTRDMIIKRPHRHVDASGLVSVPYLQNWMFPRSNLVELVRNLSLIFGQDPPLYSKPCPHSPPVNSFHTINPVHTGGIVMTHPPPSSSALRPLSSLPQTQQHPYPPYRHPTPPPTQMTGRTDPAADMFRINAVNTLVERAQHDIVDIRKATEMDMDRLANSQSLLRQREEQCKQGLRELQHEKEALEQQLQAVLTNTDVLETWLEANEKRNMDFDIDDVFEPCDALSKQLLECTASDLAIEDLLYALDKAVQEGAIPVDAYLKHVRILSREQFFHRATAVKVRAAQAQLQVVAMATRVGIYGS